MRISDWSSDVCSSDLEGGGTAAFSGAQVQGLDGARGQFSVEAARAAIRPTDRYHPQTRMIAVEQTTNMGGGAICSLQDITALGALAEPQGTAYHMDGPRPLTEVVASGFSAQAFARHFAPPRSHPPKGLDCPFGAAS